MKIKVKKILFTIIALVAELVVTFFYFKFLYGSDVRIIIKNTVLVAFCLAIVGHYGYAEGLLSSEAVKLFKGHMIYFALSLLVAPWSNWDDFFYSAMVNLGSVVVLFFINLFITTILRTAFNKFCASRVVIFGVGHNAVKVYKTLKFHHFSTKIPVCFIDLNGDPNFPNFVQENKLTYDITKKCPVYKYKDLAKVFKKRKPDVAAIAAFGLTYEETKKLEKSLENKTSKIMYVPEHKNLTTCASRIEEYDGMVMIESSLKNMNWLQSLTKRAFDIILSLIGIIILIPVTIFVRVGMWCTGDFGPLYFKHVRVGKNGKEFAMLKFRSMRVDAKERLEELLASNEEIRKEYELNKKIANDPRITKFGKFLRRFKIDEFPQFYNIFIGQMSFIGPRPVPKEEVEDTPEYYEVMIKMKPGVTGMWQTVSYNDTTIESRLRLDDFYYHNYSLGLDIKIIFLTIVNILKGRITE